MATVNTNNITVNDVIKFKSKNPYDKKTYIGTIVALCDFNIARKESDVVRYNTEVQSIYPTVPDERTLKYMIIQESDDVSPIAFGIDWILEGSLVLVDLVASSIVQIYDTTEKSVTAAIELLADNGFICKQVEE